MTTSSPELTTHKAGLPADVEDKLHATKEAVQAKTEGVKQYLQKGSETAYGKAEEATLQVRSAASGALAKVPASMSGRVERLAELVRHRPMPTAAVLLSVLVLLVLRRLLRRNG